MSDLKDLTNKDVSSDDSDYDDVDNLIGDKIKTFQVQFVKDEYYKFSLVGYFKKEENFTVELTRFEHEDYFCVIVSNFLKVEDTLSSGIYLYDLITLNVLKKDGVEYKLILSVEMDSPKINEENKGNLMIWFETNHNGFKRVPLKTELTHPGNEKLPYYIINEMKNEKITKLLYQT